MVTGKNFQLAFEVGGKVAASLPKSFGVASQAVARLNQELSEIRQQQRSVKKLQDMKLKVGQTAKAYHKAAARVEQLHQQLSQTESPTRAMTREFERAKTQSSNLRNALRKQRQELVTLKRGFDDADTSARHLALRNKELAASADRNRLAQSRSVEQVHRYKVALGEARRNIQQTRRAQETFNRALEQQRALKVAALGEAKGKLFSSAAQTAAVTGGAMLAAAKAANFNRENQLIGNTADMSANEVKAMGDAMLITARQTGQFTDDIQAAQGYLVAAGQGYREAQANLKTIGQTATATGADILDVSKATFILGDALKINPKEMQAALDILVQSGKEGNFEFNDMAKTLPVLGAQFQSLKMGGTEAAATMGAALQIARKGASTSDEAANNMKNFMAKILAPVTLKRAEKEFDVDLYAIITKAQKSGKNPFEAATEIRDYLPFSDAKIGPFSELTRSGAAIMGTLAQGVNRSNTLQTAIAEQFNNASGVGGGISGANNRVSAAAGSAGMLGYGTSITFAPVIHLPPGSPAENRAAVERGLKTASDEFEKKMKEIANQNRRLSYG